MKGTRMGLAGGKRTSSALMHGEDLDDDDEKEFSLAYDDGVLPGHVPLREQVPELDHKLLPKLHVAAREEKPALVAAILKMEEEDVNCVDPAHQTALHFACGARIGPLGEDPTLEVVRMLMQGGANANKKDATGSTPLHNAVRSGRLEVVRQLLAWKGSHKVNVHVSDVFMDTPLHLAVKLRRVEIVKILLEHGASVAVLNLDNMTPPYIARELNFTELIDVFLTVSNAQRLGRIGSTTMQ
ncbi:Ankyrin repeat domain-containing protein 1 [Hondaea fermentalgiana]|uniref:Ankyrin repeat domain-containing protein 1 n=1 Tax=Hondaea fermentalgiana TaxID=2315210 RepID=A0A2R5GUJ1_9STRA|nr:Ankyrin repeat domain-containing protein 1 [Hondaea fermentalgiana]|eukprot:GBG34536.1 Ankyrin repeat domain-containing protein 1 [Hondaea fermentalgiana]